MDSRSSLVLKYPLIDNLPVSIDLSVLWGDMDAAQHVNNTVYLRWCETARIEYFRTAQIDTSFTLGVAPILGWLDAKYIRPITYPDQVLITVEVTELKTDRLTMESRVYSLKNQHLALISKQEIIPYNYEKLYKTPFPNSWIEALRTLQPDL